MLLEFACSNHKSIRDEILFSTLAGKGTSCEMNVYELPGMNVLKSAVIYGANGSGKSNFIDAIAFVKDLVKTSINNQPGQGIRQTPHKLDSFGKESTYKVQFITKGVRYVFGFSLQNSLVSDEYLYYFPNNRKTKIYERSRDGFSSSRKFKSKLSTCKDVLKENRLLLSCAANFSNVQEVVDAFLFFSNDLVIYGPGNYENWLNYSLHQMESEPHIKKTVLALLGGLGTGIKDVKIAIDKKKFEPAELPSFLSDDFKALIMQNEFDSITAKVVYDEFETDLMREESTGIKKLFGMLCPLIDIMTNGKVFICDELESSLHESLVCGLVKLFSSAEFDNLAQMIFTTHNTSLLNLNLFRRDQIWFTEMKQDGRATDLYSLAEIRNIRKEENFERCYIAGKYGSIPMLNLEFANNVSKT